MVANLNVEFDKADKILSSAIEEFQSAEVSQHVWGMALVEVGVSALIKVDENEETIINSIKEFIERAK